jgi:thiol-disulfide isomerase/thioredoxin
MDERTYSFGDTNYRCAPNGTGGLDCKGSGSNTLMCVVGVVVILAIALLVYNCMCGARGQPSMFGFAAKPGGGGKAKEVANAAEYESLSRKGSTLAMFYAPWCGHCKASMPAFEAASKQSTGTRFLKVNGDSNQELVRKLNIRGYPTFVRSGVNQHPMVVEPSSRTTQAFVALTK